ncbi:DUF6223 family protein [Prauserella flavalba]|uniref:Uncharacterized protein n=1 Tax=Prauserella flavalba TaxID=1477506 RepID=A0A318LSM7_9PSEU|nr:hypothetical protein BA062_03690 [Prauserella flavalba]
MHLGERPIRGDAPGRLAVADGGLGTGNGVAGGALALVAGLVAAVLGGLVLARSRRAPVQ